MFSVAIAMNTPKIMYCTCELLKHMYATLVSDYSVLHTLYAYVVKIINVVLISFVHMMSLFHS